MSGGRYVDQVLSDADYKPTAPVERFYNGDGQIDADDRNGLKQALLEIIGHLGAARCQRAPSDDAIIAGHIDHAYVEATVALRGLQK